MKIVIAPDSFKESVSANDAAEAIATGMRRALPHARYDLIPMADGGEGTTAALVSACGGERIETRVTAPLGDAITACYGILGDGQTAIVEIAAASGLALVPGALRDPIRSTTFGTGELIRAALNRGSDKIIVGLGGSATTDGGAGMLQALGLRCYDAARREMKAPMGGGDLRHVMAIDPSKLDPRLTKVRFDAACDVDNPLTGPNGAAHTFGPQKGADKGQIEQLDRGLVNFYQVVENLRGIDVSKTQGAGAAGGLGAALLGFMDARLRPGIDLVVEAVGLGDRVRDATLVITGEGRIDTQTLRGKTPLGVARVSAKHGVPVVAIGGSLAPDARAVFAGGIDALEAAVTRPMSAADAIQGARAHLEDAGERVARWLILAQGLNLENSSLG